ncbi:MAG: prefoldin subunit alpha [Euryarchaeota archaeon]|nr:prefoldin subunit alpha [Euryarchaeota archaeon]NDB93694.1 prefoldin subunit alpha [Euryarchaeota archaeon]NDF22270.1 prefoldin subunit alpha [Euryarchaeota archaeon]NDF36766.1 prefoldin subunit alpha [Euryarchaeota archaeon]NDG21618.1 prefoldin subunit alpha [Euryarchaeota archaeon]
MTADEARRIARLIEANHTRLQSMKSQVERLNSLFEEQSRAHETLQSVRISEGGITMVPLGSGVQIPVNVNPNLKPIIDIGSGVQIETDGEKAMQMLDQRNKELEGLIKNMLVEIKQTDESIIEMEKQIMALEGHSKDSEEQKKKTKPNSTPPKVMKGRRKRGTELTLDD